MTQARKITKAVFPVAGLGTRFLPATKSTPKELLPIVDQPLIQYAVNEAVEAGIETLIFITSRKKHSISDHFDISFELETKLRQAGKDELLARTTNLVPEHVSLVYVPQKEARGLGHAVLCARDVIGDEPFAVLLADDLIKSEGPGCLSQMLRAWEATGDSQLAVQDVPREHTSRYGIVDLEQGGQGGVLRGIMEKPAPEVAPSTLGVVGRYVLSARVLDLLARTKPGAGGEIQLTDAIAELLGEETVRAFPFEGTRYDCGSKMGFVKATVDYALDRDDMRDELIRYVTESRAIRQAIRQAES